MAREAGYINPRVAAGAALEAAIAADITTLDGLTDVDTSTVPPTDGQALVFDLPSGLWVPGSMPVPPDVLDDLSDVDTTTTPPTDGQALVFDLPSGLWVPGNLPSSATVRRLTVVADAGAAHTLAPADIWGHRRFTNAGAIAVTVDGTHGFSIGDRARFTQAGAGQITFTGTGIALNSRGAALKSAGQFAVLELECVGAAEFDVLGDVTT